MKDLPGPSPWILYMNRRNSNTNTLLFRHIAHIIRTRKAFLFRLVPGDRRRHRRQRVLVLVY